MNERPTKKQKELLDFIDGFIKGNGYGPSYREVMRALGYKSVSTVATHIDGLIARGWLLKKDHSARSLTVVMPSYGELHTTATVKTPTVTAEKEILDRIDELKGEGYDLRSHEIKVLIEALEILGYKAAHDTHLV